MERMEIVGIGGQAQNGKDTLADYLQSQLNRGPGITYWKRTAFAKAVKDIYCKTFDKDYAFVEKWKVIDECPPGMDMTVRKALQFIGDGFRKIKASIWIDLMFRDSDAKIVSDARYINELEAIKLHGGFNIVVARPDKLNNDPNGSEAQIRPLAEWAIRNKNMQHYPVSEWIDFDDLQTPAEARFVDMILVNEGSLEDLYRQVNHIIIPNIHKYFKR